jgi:FixJ family two-component response regulator
MRPETPGAAIGIGERGLPDPTRVLLVDDDPAVRGSLKFAFELEGFEVADFASAELVDDKGANCLVLDYRLPGMNGLQLLDLLRRSGSKAPAIIITSHPNRKIREQIAAANATLIEKPLLCDALTGAIRALAEERRLSA